MGRALVVAAGIVGLARVASGAVPPPLTTPWPSHVACPAFSAIDLSVDSRVHTIEWRGSGAPSLSIPVTPPPPDPAEVVPLLFAKVSADRRTSEASRPISMGTAYIVLAPDFAAGKLDTLVLQEDVPNDRRPRPGNGSPAFGLRLALGCSDTTKPSLQWTCDDRSCLLRSFRDNPKAGPGAQGPYRDDWVSGSRNRDLARLKPASLARERTTVIALARDLLSELGIVIESACGDDACSPRLAALRDTARALAASPALTIAGSRAVAHPRGDLGHDALPAWAWTARFRDGSGEAKVTCSYQTTADSAGEPVGVDCHTSVRRRGVRLADYLPDHHQQIELPDGGAIQPRATDPRGRAYGDTRDQIVIIGSALATAAPTR